MLKGNVVTCDVCVFLCVCIAVLFVSVCASVCACIFYSVTGR
jgi:hypothetical protein